VIRRAWNYVLLALGIALVAVTFFAWAVVSWLMGPLLPTRAGRRLGRLGAMINFRWILWVMEMLGAWRLDLAALDELRSGGPLIVAPNHPALLDALLVVSRMPNAVCVMKGSLLGHFLLGPASRLARYVPNDSLLKLVTRAGDELREGGQLLLFPEGTRTVGGPVGPLTEAVGAISKRTNVPIQVVIIEASAPFLGKRWPLWAPPPFPVTYRARLGRRFEPPKDVRAFTEELDRHFRRELAAHAVESEEAGTPAVQAAQQLRG
jgi:1-acyl-sn-glycerol-3-phosphate acyltransferase